MIEKYERELSRFDRAGTKTTIRFRTDKPLPEALVRKIVRARVSQLGD